MKNIFYEVDKNAFMKLSKALQKDRPSFKEIQEIILGLKRDLKERPIPLTEVMLKKLEDLKIIREVKEI